jgi:hypothetical protein
VHPAATHHGRDDSGNLERPGFVVAPDAEYKAALADSAQEMPLRKKAHPPNMAFAVSQTDH